MATHGWVKRSVGIGAAAVIAGVLAGAPTASATGGGSGGTRHTSSGAVPASVTGADRVVPRSVSGGPVLPGPAAGGDRALTGTHGIYLVPVYWGSTKPAALDNAALQSAIDGANTYYTAASGGTLTVRQGWAEGIPGWSKITLTDAQSTSCDLKAINDAVRAVVGSAGPRDHLVVYLPKTTQCTFSDLETFGLSARGDGYSIVNGTFTTDIALRVIAHNGSVSAAGSLNCTSGASAVPLSSTCSGVDYNNPWDPASAHPYGQPGMPLADTLATLGILSATDYPEISPGPTKALPLKPMESGAGLRGAWFDLEGYRYSIEYRTPTGLDSWIDDKKWSGPFGTVSDPGGHIVVHRQPLTGDAIDRSRLVVDFHPDLVNSDTQRHPGLWDGESYTSPDGSFALSVSAPSPTGATVTVSFPALDRVVRWSGPDRYATSATISAQTYAAGVSVAYVASGSVYTDALSGAPVAGDTDGPILLTSGTSIPSVIAAELTRLKPGKIVIFGGPATISPDVETALKAYTSGAVERWSGDDRFTTSAAISAKSYAPGVATAYVASGRVFTDALSGAPVAGKSAGPVLLVDTNALPSAIGTELQRLKPAKIVIFGGPNTITPAVEASLHAYAASVERWSGPDRFTTSTAITQKAYSTPGGTIFIASGRVYTDALSGAPVAGTMESPVLLVDTDALPDAVGAEIDRLKPSRIVILGGPNTISYGVQAALAGHLK